MLKVASVIENFTVVDKIGFTIQGVLWGSGLHKDKMTNFSQGFQR